MEERILPAGNRPSAARCPTESLILTTGAESTDAFGGHDVALGPGPLTLRVLAPAFGHLLGFADAYIRTYDDLMAASRHGKVDAHMIDTLITNYRPGGEARRATSESEPQQTYRLDGLIYDQHLDFRLQRA
jgi:hypothetical protein